jgi:pyruvate dehydrogenase E2 component (dihydrolipoamide acetyltransferase)
MPRQGNTVESCIITNWKVKEGDTVTAQTIVCEVETDKATFEVPAETTGTVLKLLYEPGDDVEVLKPIAVIGTPGEDWQAAISQNNPSQDIETLKPESKNDMISSPDAHVPLRDSSSTKASPRAKNLADKEALSLPVPGSGPGGRIIERDVVAALENQPPLTAAAKAAGTGIVRPVGSGLGGRVTLEDLTSVGQPSSFHTTHTPEGAITETPIKGIRKIIADRMYSSLAQSAQFTLNASASAAKLQDFRSRIKAPGALVAPGALATQGLLTEELGLSKITINDLILFAVSRVLPRFPYMNAHKNNDIIKTFERVHLGNAVDTPRGLMVPVIRNSNLLTLSQISSEAKRLATACQNGTVKPDELSGSSFTVTNLGSLGITNFTPVLNAPEVAILGVCNIEMKPVVSSGECNCCCRFEPQIGFSLTIDHQVVDGAPAARFLKALGEAVANIDLLLASA